MRVEDAIFEHHSITKIDMGSNQTDLVIKYFNEFNNVKFYHTIDITLSYDDDEIYLNKIIEEVKKIDDERGTCELIILSMDKYYTFINLDYEEIETLFIDMFPDDLYDERMNTAYKIIIKSQSGLILSESFV